MKDLNEELHTRFQDQGFVIVESVTSAATLQELTVEVLRLQSDSAQNAGVRNVLQKSKRLADFAESQMKRLANFFLKAESQLVKITIFDKTPSANWKVPIHQDLSIAVQERIEVDGFHPWSTKEGIPHVLAPDFVLRSMVAIRLHLDHCDEQNGALRVVPGSHRQGRLRPEEILELRKTEGEHVCAVDLGGALVMSPLIAHASSPVTNPYRRLVLHFEFAATELPGGLRWIRE